jgi:predicted DCC family thiol-disulfide oxidoreductase YuxK
MAQSAPAAGPAQLPDRIVFYDGVCAFCNGAVRWMIERDAGARLRFAPLQGETAALLRAERAGEFPADIDTMVFAERSGDEVRLWVRMQAALRILETLDAAPGWRWLLRALPGPLAELAYRIFAALRYRTFGRLDACPLPPPALRARFLP